jgi:hypothetical protein
MHTPAARPNPEFIREDLADLPRRKAVNAEILLHRSQKKQASLKDARSRVDFGMRCPIEPLIHKFEGVNGRPRPAAAGMCQPWPLPTPCVGRWNLFRVPLPNQGVKDAPEGGFLEMLWRSLCRLRRLSHNF